VVSELSGSERLSSERIEAALTRGLLTFCKIRPASADHHIRLYETSLRTSTVCGFERHIVMLLRKALLSA
jgi:hypothetical protein